MTIEWACSFCNESTKDDPRSAEMGISFEPDDGPKQFFHAHFECLRNALHPAAAAELLDPLSSSD